MIMPYTSETRVSGEVEITADIMSPMKMFDYGASNGLIISTDLGVIREILDDSTAVFCDENDINDWVSKILTLIQDKTYQKKLRSNALKLVKEKYGWDSRAVKIYSLGM
jgi:glycosyltransferase involved in cell wall biosynthesis